MIIETIDNLVHDVEIKFEDLEPGVVFQLGNDHNSIELGPKILKLTCNLHVVLTGSSGENWFVLGDGSLIKDRKIVKVWGKLVGLKVQL